MRQETNTRTILRILIALSCLIPLLFVRFPQTFTLQTTTLYISALTGYAGVAMLVWMHILGTRSLLKHFVRDYARVLKIHSWLGKYGTLAIFAHPIFIMVSYSETLLYIFVPHIGDQFDNRVTLGRIALYFVILIWVTSAIVRGKIADRPWKYIHYLSYIILPFALLHVPDVGSSFISSIAAKAFIFASGLLLVITLLFRAYALLSLDRFAYRVGENRELTPGIFQLTLYPVSKTIAPAYGQYVFIKLGLISEDHPFSVVYTNPSTGALVLTYKRYRMFTREMTKLQPGQTVTIDGPYGSFTSELAHVESPTVFVAGGIGITPFMSHLFSTNSQERWLFYTTPTQENAAYLPELRSHLGSNVIGLFQTLPDTADFGEKSWVTADTFSRHLSNPATYQYYLCGPPAMVKMATKSLRSLGVSATQIHTEAFSF